MSTSSWEHFDKSMETNKAQWLTNQYPVKWSAKVASDALCKIIEGKDKPLDSEKCLSTQSPKDVKYNIEVTKANILLTGYAK